MVTALRPWVTRRLSDAYVPRCTPLKTRLIRCCAHTVATVSSGPTVTSAHYKRTRAPKSCYTPRTSAGSGSPIEPPQGCHKHRHKLSAHAHTRPRTRSSRFGPHRHISSACAARRPRPPPPRPPPPATALAATDPSRCASEARASAVSSPWWASVRLPRRWAGSWILVLA